MLDSSLPYPMHALTAKTILRVIIISLVGKYSVNTIRGRIQFEGEIYLRKYGILGKDLLKNGILYIISFGNKHSFLHSIVYN